MDLSTCSTYSFGTADYKTCFNNIMEKNQATFADKTSKESKEVLEQTQCLCDNLNAKGNTTGIVHDYVKGNLERLLPAVTSPYAMDVVTYIIIPTIAVVVTHIGRSCLFKGSPVPVQEAYDALITAYTGTGAVVGVNTKISTIVNTLALRQ